MKREVSRSAATPAFELSIGELEALMIRLQSIFTSEKDAHIQMRSHIDVQLKGEKITFETIEEFRDADFLPDRLNRWSVWISDDKQRIWIDSDNTFNEFCKIRVTSDSEAWCAGAIETALSFLGSKKKWFTPLLKFPSGWVFLFFAFIVPALAMNISAFDFPLNVSSPIYLGLASIFIIQTVVAKSVLIVRVTKSKFREYVPEMGLAVAVMAMLITVFSLFKGS